MPLKGSTTRVPQSCQQCGQTFHPHIADVKKGKARFCSHACKYEHGHEERACLVCGAMYRIRKSNPRMCCSRSCLSVLKRRVRVPPMECTCHSCGKVFLRTPSMVEEKRRTYCSKACLYRGRRTSVDRTCLSCGKPLIVQRGKAKMSERSYCSHRCYGLMNRKLDPSAATYSQERHILMSRGDYHTWRLAVFTRDHFTCQICGSRTSGTLNAHHVLPWKSHPDRRYDVANGVTCCRDCHRKIKHNAAPIAYQQTPLL